MLEKKINWSIIIYILIIIFQIIEIIQIRYESSSSFSSSISSSSSTSSSSSSSFFSFLTLNSYFNNIFSLKNKLKYNKKKKEMTFQSNNSIGYYLWLYLIKLIKLKQYLKKKHLSKSFIYEKNIPNDYKSIYVEVEYTFLSKLNSYFTNIFLYWYNNFNNHITNHIIAVENFNDVRNFSSIFYLLLYLNYCIRIGTVLKVEEILQLVRMKQI